MGKNKLKKFAEMKGFHCVVEAPRYEIADHYHEYRGKWNGLFFRNPQPIVLELGCGKGEYTVGLARRFPDKNFIGIDIKGARMYTGATQALGEQLSNVAFLRTSIELLESFFATGEVSEIWITFPDPQMKKVNKRLTSTRLNHVYARVMTPGGTIHLKTDSPFLYTYTRLMVMHNNLPVVTDTPDLYNSDVVSDILDIKTHYERQWLSRGMSIKYLSYTLDHTPTVEPTEEIEHDNYRSYNHRTPLPSHLKPGQQTDDNSQVSA